MSEKVTVTRLVLLFVVSLVSTLLMQCIATDVSAHTFSECYSLKPNTSKIQSQVVYYLLGEFSEMGVGARIFIGETFHTALLPGSCTVFCLPPCIYSFKTVLNGGPGSTLSKATRVRLEQGATQFFRLGATGNEGPSMVSKEEAEKELDDTFYQVHVLSHAPAVQTCGDQAYYRPFAPWRGQYIAKYV